MGAGSKDPAYVHSDASMDPGLPVPSEVEGTAAEQADAESLFQAIDSADEKLKTGRETIGTAVTLFPVVRRQNEAMALGFVAVRTRNHQAGHHRHADACSPRS